MKTRNFGFRVVQKNCSKVESDNKNPPFGKCDVLRRFKVKQISLFIKKLSTKMENSYVVLETCLYKIKGSSISKVPAISGGNSGCMD